MDLHTLIQAQMELMGNDQPVASCGLHGATRRDVIEQAIEYLQKSLACWNMRCYFYHYLLIISQIPFLSEPFLYINPLSCNFLIILAIVALDNLVI